MNVPHLKKKLDLLFWRDNVVTNQTKLAIYLGVKPASISIWINGITGGRGENAWIRAPELVPDKHINTLRMLFDIVPEWLETETVEEFQQLLNNRPLERTPWEALFAQAVNSEAIEIVRRIGERSFRYQDEPGELPVESFQEGEKVYIRFTLEEGWLYPGQRPHLVLLIVDRHKTTCLCPSDSAFAPSHEVTQQVVRCPVRAPGDYLTVERPTGEQVILALLTRRALPENLYEELKAAKQELLPALDRLATYVGTVDNGDWQFVKKTCEVYPHSLTNKQ